MQNSAEPMEFLIRDHLPHAEWTVGGAFRYDRHLLTMLSIVSQHFSPRRVARVAGVPPCAWSLDMYHQRHLLSLQGCVERLRAFAEEKIGFIVVFDNPAVSGELLQDSFGHWLVEQLVKPEYNPTGQNAVCVASEALADALAARYPKVKLICHPNLHIMAAAKRTPAYYARLEQKFSRIVLHPRDAVSSSLFKSLSRPERYEVVLNDPTPRNFPSRRELLGVLAELRRKPYDAKLRNVREKMLTRSGMFTWENTCNLTMNEERALYEAGIRSYVIQSALFRNEMTLWYDFFFHLFRTQPEHSNKAAVIASVFMSHIRENTEQPVSGLKDFSYTGIE